MKDEKIISKILNIINYYIDNKRYSIESEWDTSYENRNIESRCTGFTVNSDGGYKIICEIFKKTYFFLHITDRYGSDVKYSSNNEIFYKFLINSVDRILSDSNVDVIERVEKENREININKLL